MAQSSGIILRLGTRGSPLALAQARMVRQALATAHGFDPEHTREDGFGLEGMRERVGLLEGKLQVESRAGAGTTIVAEVPVS